MKEAKDLEEYLSAVRHDLRSQLAMAQEAVNQALDGLGNKDILRLAVSAIKKIDKLIEERLDYSKIRPMLKAPPVKNSSDN